MKRAIFIGVAAAVTFMASGALAAISVIGTGSALMCYQAALAARSDSNSVRTCNSAIEDEALSAIDRAATRVNRGIIRVNRREYANAMTDFNEAIRLRPELGEAHVNRGAALVYLQDFDAAVESLTRGIELSSDEVHKAYYNRALAYEELGDLRSAYSDYQRAAELAPDWTLPRTELARYSVRER